MFAGGANIRQPLCAHTCTGNNNSLHSSATILPRKAGPPSVSIVASQTDSTAPTAYPCKRSHSIYRDSHNIKAQLWMVLTCTEAQEMKGLPTCLCQPLHAKSKAPSPA